MSLTSSSSKSGFFSISSIIIVLFIFIAFFMSNPDLEVNDVLLRLRDIRVSLSLRASNKALMPSSLLPPVKEFPSRSIYLICLLCFRVSASASKNLGPRRLFSKEIFSILSLYFRARARSSPSSSSSNFLLITRSFFLRKYNCLQ